MKDLRIILTLLAALTIAIGGVNVHAATHAGKILYAFGQVQANDGSGKGRKLRKGDLIFTGETVATRRGRAQIRFTDGGFASLQPNTQYRIDDYNYAGNADGKERSFLSLLRGSVRLVTGVIGKANRSRFRIKTTVATIGIRGTSGKISHCDSDCGNIATGTQIQGYGGTWDLVSGSFSGPVEAGDAYLCDGGTCQQLQGGVAQREDIDAGFALGDEDEESEGNTYQQGQQIDSSGARCDLGGSCGVDTVVLLNQVVASVFPHSFFDDTEAQDGIELVLFNGFPIGGFSFGETDPDHPDSSIFTVNFTAMRNALNAFPDPDVVALANQLLDSVDAETLAALESNPASVAPEDFGPTSDNVLMKGRFVDGFTLDINKSLSTGEVSFYLEKLTNFQSGNFIYGPNPKFFPSGGMATYNFTGGTFSTATDGSSIGLGVTAGQIMWDFGLGYGSVDMTVEHGPDIFAINGSLLSAVQSLLPAVQQISPKFFHGNMVSAFINSGSRSYPVTVDGFFAGPNGTSAPSAAGLAYAIDMSWSKPYDIIGVAGFGLGSFGPSTAAPVAPTAVATGTYIAVADTFYDGSSNNGTGWDLIIDGSTNVATEIGNSVNSFSGSNSQPQCTSSCTFTAGTATQLESGDFKFLDVENALIGASWVRWSTGHEFTHNFDDPNIGHAHLIKLVAPASPLPTSGVGTYTVFGGGTTPTLSSGPGEANTVTATGPSTHTITVNFDYGAMTATHEIPFPTTTVSVFGSVQSGPVSMQNSIHFSGDLIGGPNACTSCVFGHDHFTFAESNAKYVVGSGQFNTSGLSPYEVSGGFTFILGDPAR